MTKEQIVKSPLFEDDISLYYDGFGAISPTLITDACISVFDSLDDEVSSLFIFGCVDPERESLAFALTRAFDYEQCEYKRKGISLQDIKPGSTVCFGDFAFELVSVEGEMFAYKQGNRRENKRNRGLVNKALSSSLPVTHLCREGAPLTRYEDKKLSLAVKEYKALPDAFRDLSDHYSSRDSSVYLATSSASFLKNIAPTKVPKGLVRFAGYEALLSRCLPVAYLNGDGVIVRKDSLPIDCSPALICASRDNSDVDLQGALECIDKGMKLRSVVLSAPSSEFVKTLDYEIRQLASRGVPTVVFCQTGSIFSSIAAALDEIGFSAFDWSCGEGFVGKNGKGFSIAQRNYLKRAKSWVLANDDRHFSTILSSLRAIEPKTGVLTDFSQSAYTGLLTILSVLLHQTEMFSEELSNTYRQRAENYFEVLLKDSALSEIEIRDLLNSRVLLYDALEPDVALPKEGVTYNLITNALSLGRSVQLIVDKSSSEEANKYWVDVLEYDGFDSSRFSTCTTKQFLKQSHPAREATAIVSGWFKRDVMDQILNSGLVDQYQLLLYKGEEGDLETAWAMRADDYFKKVERRCAAISVSSFRKNGIPVPDYIADALKKAPKVEARSSDPTNNIAEEDDSFPAFVLKVRSELADKNIIRDENESCLARPIFFTDGKMRWCRCAMNEGGERGEAVPVLSLEGSACVERRRAHELMPGDLVILSESDSVAIGSAAKAVTSGYDELYRVARSWREPIDKALKYMSTESVCRAIEKAGCKKSTAAIRGWVSGRVGIAPQDREDIEFIFQAFREPYNEEKISRICNAASRIHGAHIRAGYDNAEHLHQELCKDVDRFGIAATIANFESRHPKLGSVELLFVEDVGDPTMVSVSNLGYYRG